MTPIFKNTYTYLEIYLTKIDQLQTKEMLEVGNPESGGKSRSRLRCLIGLRLEHLQSNYGMRNNLKLVVRVCYVSDV